MDLSRCTKSVPQTRKHTRIRPAPGKMSDCKSTSQVSCYTGCRLQTKEASTTRKLRRTRRDGYRSALHSPLKTQVQAGTANSCTPSCFACCYIPFRPTVPTRLPKVGLVLFLAANCNFEPHLMLFRSLLSSKKAKTYHPTCSDTMTPVIISTQLNFQFFFKSHQQLPSEIQT